MGLKCGIDLGTTYSAISWYDEANGRVDTVDLSYCADNERIVRSVVYYAGKDQDPVVGQTAWNQRKQFPERVIVGIKRSMGIPGFLTPPIDGREYSPEEVSAEVIKALVKDASAYLGGEVTDVVITVPAYFDDPQCAATRRAGELAGVNVIDLFPEPQAAALAYCIDKALELTDKPLLVYDLGGGTFDVVLMRPTASADATNALNLKIDTLSKRGNARRGGLDWDDALSELVAEKVRQSDDIDILQDDKNMPVLLDNCERAKRDLGRTSPAFVVADMAAHQAEVTRSEFEDRTASFLLETQSLMEEVLQEAEEQHGISRDDIAILLAGGATKMPMVREMIERVTGRPPLEHGNPELLVSRGAAYYAHLYRGEGDDAGPGPVIKKPTLADDGTVVTTNITVDPVQNISAYAVGVEVLRSDGHGGMVRKNAVVVPKGATHDTYQEKEFYKAEDDMDEIRIVLYKSETDTDNLDECTSIKTFVIGPLPAGGHKGDAVRVSLGHGSDGILRGEAVDVTTGQRVDIVVDADALAGRAAGDDQDAPLDTVDAEPLDDEPQ